LVQLILALVQGYITDVLSNRIPFEYSWPIPLFSCICWDCEILETKACKNFRFYSIMSI